MTEIYRDIDNKVHAFQKNYNLDGESFYIELRYNPICNSWFLTLKDQDFNIIISSIRIVSKIFLFRNKRAVGNLPKGDFKIIQKTSGRSDKNIDFDTFGDEFKLYYFNQSEVVY
jgi:hypothetical protein